MKILVVGGRGTIGQAVVAALLQEEHEVLVAGRSGGDYSVDLQSSASIQAMYAEIGELNAVVSCAGEGAFGGLEELSEEDFQLCVTSKLMGQVNLARLGISFLSEGGSITLTSGVLAHEPMPGSAAVSMVNAGLEAFAGAAALELPRGIRINVVSPPWVSETLIAMGRDPEDGIPVEKVAQAYLAAVNGSEQGSVIDARKFG
jgi:NAD(P)-dependent dehydrogenase (short-subunit alcohol dehydrogenase family)